MSVLDGNGPMQVSGAHVVDQLTGVGFGVTILILSLCLSLLGNYLLFKRICSLTDQMFSIIPQTTATVLNAVDDFKEVLNGYIKKS